MRLAISTLRSRGLGHADLVDRQRDQRGAVRRCAIGTTRSSLSRPASRLTELTIARPGIWSSARLDHLGLGRVDLDRRGLRERDLLGHEPHLLVLVVALGQRDAEVEHVRAALDLVLGDLQQAVVVVGEQQLLGLARALRVHALADDRRARLLHERRRRRSWTRRAAGAGRGRAPIGVRRRSAPRSRGCARAWCRSSRRRCRRRSARRTRPAPRPAARAARGRSSRRPGPGGGCRRSGCSGPAAARTRRGSGSRRACPRGRWSS